MQGQPAEGGWMGEESGSGGRSLIRCLTCPSRTGLCSGRQARFLREAHCDGYVLEVAPSLLASFSSSV
jgi:hypothetical protein